MNRNRVLTIFQNIFPYQQFIQILSPLINIMLKKYIKLFFAHYEHYPSFK